MGSFTSAPKIMNGDVQDDDVDFSCVATQAEMKTRCQTELVSLPPLIQRQFRHVRIPSASPDIAAEPIRVLQWNILSQSLGVHNDSFVNCPPEALDWRTRRYRILAEIIEHSPDIICLQVTTTNLKKHKTNKQTNKQTNKTKKIDSMYF